MNKIEREKRIVTQMIKLYCRHKEKNKELCDRCRQLTLYATARLDHCKYGNNKKSCKRCPIHCYKPEMKAQIKQVMRWAGPRMLFYHPIECIRHVL